MPETALSVRSLHALFYFAGNCAERGRGGETLRALRRSLYSDRTHIDIETGTKREREREVGV